MLLANTDVAEDLRIRLIPEMGTPEKFLETLATKQVTNLDPETRWHPDHRQRWTEAVGILANEEISTVFGKEAHRGGGQWVKLLGALHAGKDTWTNSTIGRGTEVLRNISISFIGGSTMEWLKYSVSEEMFRGGFMSRCIIVPRDDVRRVMAWPGIMDPLTAETLAGYLAEIAQQEFTEFRITPEANDYFEDWYGYNHERLRDDPLFRGWIGRKPPHVWRLASVLALSDHTEVIQLKHFKTALACIDHEERKVPAIMAELTESKEAEGINIVEGVIRAHGGWMSKGNLSGKCYRKVGGSRKIKDALEVLVEMQSIEFDKRGRTMFYRIKRKKK